MKEFHKYPKIYRLGHLENEDIFENLEHIIIVQEKIDGANFRFKIKDGKVVYGSRTQQLTSDEGDETNAPKNFRRCIDYLKDKLSSVDLSFPDNLIFYGECCVKHRLNYDWDKIPPFIGFDIYDCQTNEFLDFREVVDIYNSLRIPVINHRLYTVKELLKTGVDESLIPISEFSPDNNPFQAEGIVFKNHDNGLRAKLVSDKFKESNKKSFGQKPSDKSSYTNDEDFVYKYCTNPRIEKLIFKKLDSGDELSMKLMGGLIKDTYNDIIEENWQDILSSNWVLDFKNCRKLVAVRVREVLKTVMINNSLNS